MLFLSLIRLFVIIIFYTRKLSRQLLIFILFINVHQMFLAFGIYVLIYLFDDITKSHSTNLQEQPGHFFFVLGLRINIHKY